MTHRLIVFVLSVLALLAMGAVAASAASALQGQLGSDGPVSLGWTELEGKSNAFTAFENELKCPGSVMAGHKYNVTPHTSIDSGTTTITVIPEYTEEKCVSVEKGTTHKATIKMNECDYVLHLGETTGVTNQYKSSFDVVCPAGKKIVFEVFLASSNENFKVCEIEVGPQSGITGATVTNNTSSEDLTIEGSFTNVSAAKHGLCGSAATSEGKLDIGDTIKGINSLGATTGIEIYEAEEVAGMLLKPDPIVFAGAGTKRPVTAENVTNVPIKNLDTGVPAGFKKMNLCLGKGLPKMKSTCVEEVECVIAGSKGFVAMSGAPWVMASSELTNC